MLMARETPTIAPIRPMMPEVIGLQLQRPIQTQSAPLLKKDSTLLNALREV